MGLLLILIGAAAACADPLIADVYPDQARYAPGDAVILTVELDNDTGVSFSGDVLLEILNGVAPAHSDRQSVALPPGGVATLSFAWTAPPLDYRGYLVRASAPGVDVATTAVDVSTDWTRFPRYGYVTEFYSGQSQSHSDWMIDRLARDFHISGLQYYDWMYRHEDVVVEGRPGVLASAWVDWRGATISTGVLRDLLDRTHLRGASAMPYFMIYGGREDYETESGVLPEWGIYEDPSRATQHSHQLAKDKFLYLFDPASASWQDHLMGEVDDAVGFLDFDGIHFDQLGYIDPVYDWAGGARDLSNGNPFTSMLNRTRSELDALAGGAPLGRYALTFNLVGGHVNGWGLPDVVINAQTDLLYSEVWGNESYQGVYDFVRWARDFSGDKALVLAAYMNYYDEQPTFSTPAVLLADAAFAVAGAHHLEMGDGDSVLSHEFFPWERKTPEPTLLTALEKYYGHLTAYQNALFDPQLEWGDGGGQWLSVGGGVVASQSPDGDCVWVQRRRLPGYDIIHLVNLLGNDDQWRNPANEPNAIVNLPLTYRIGDGFDIRGAWAVSPDAADASPQALSYVAGADDVGPFISFDVPLLKYWTTVLIERDGAAPPGGRYEAEGAIKAGVAVDNDHPRYSGVGFVDEFEGPDDGVSFYVNVPVDGDYDLRFRYANASGATATRRVIVDGVDVGDASFPDLGSWDSWGDAYLNVSLAAGLRHVVVGFGGSLPINFDYLELPALTGGLTGAYYDLVNFADRRAVRLDGPIDFTWNAALPTPALEDAPYLVRWSGRLTPPNRGTYTFFAESAGGVRLFVDGELVIDNWTDHALSEDSGDIYLANTQPVDLVLLYRHETGEARISLAWQATGLPKQIIPAGNLAPAEQPIDRHGPTAPTALAVQQTGPATIDLSWAASVDDVALAGYRVYDNGALTLRTSDVSASLAGLATGVVHEIEVYAADVFGNESLRAAVATVGVPADPLGDTDQDGDVDAVDWLALCGCIQGPGVVVEQSCRLIFDAEPDTDVDLADAATFQANFTGDTAP